ncbi:MAG: CocE/NonD family hydrolase C-terminal non-catalytic domain-containing protein [Balneolaceae bacterium]
MAVKLPAATDGRDTDWMIKLVDVHPDGTAMPVAEGMLRAKFHQGLEEINLLTPNQVYEFDIEMTGTANVFRPGHLSSVFLVTHSPEHTHHGGNANISDHEKQRIIVVR